MKNKTLLRVFLACCMLTGGAGCVTAPASPHWAGKIWTDKQYLYATGIASACPDDSCAKNGAYADALHAAAEYAGIRIKTQTRVETSDGSPLLTAVYQAQTDELQLHSVEIDDFKTRRTEQGVTGYIVLKIARQELERAKRLQEEAFLQEQARLERKKQLGLFYVPPVKGWPELTAGTERVLRAQQYSVGTRGTPVEVQVVLFQCETSALTEVQICTLQASLAFRGKKHTFSAKGYGRTVLQAKREAVSVWLNELPENVVE
ncbi:MAG: hypothetical protein Q4P84_08445 [Elusimicrobiales bacterium]|nr:hypothetical protein [Elusimicrobiales bacterium]